jgi:hypothetical protein
MDYSDNKLLYMETRNRRQRKRKNKHGISLKIDEKYYLMNYQYNQNMILKTQKMFNTHHINILESIFLCSMIWYVMLMTLVEDILLLITDVSRLDMHNVNFIYNSIY